MKRKELKEIIREALREEITEFVIPLVKDIVAKQYKKTNVRENFNEIKNKGFSLMEELNDEPEKRERKKKMFSKNNPISDILNETVNEGFDEKGYGIYAAIPGEEIDETDGSLSGASVIEEIAQVDDEKYDKIKSILTKDYSGIIKKAKEIDKRRKT